MNITQFDQRPKIVRIKRCGLIEGGDRFVIAEAAFINRCFFALEAGATAISGLHQSRFLVVARTENGQCPFNIKVGEFLSRSADGRINIRPVIRGLNRIIRAGNQSLNRCSNGGFKLFGIYVRILPRRLEQRREKFGINSLFSGNRR